MRSAVAAILGALGGFAIGYIVGMDTAERDYEGWVSPGELDEMMTWPN